MFNLITLTSSSSCHLPQVTQNCQVSLPRTITQSPYLTSLVSVLYGLSLIHVLLMPDPQLVMSLLDMYSTHLHCPHPLTLDHDPDPPHDDHLHHSCVYTPLLAPWSSVQDLFTRLHTRVPPPSTTSATPVLILDAVASAIVGSSLNSVHLSSFVHSITHHLSVYSSKSVTSLMSGHSASPVMCDQSDQDNLVNGVLAWEHHPSLPASVVLHGLSIPHESTPTSIT